MFGTIIKNQYQSGRACEERCQGCEYYPDWTVMLPHVHMCLYWHGCRKDWRKCDRNYSKQLKLLEVTK